MRHPKPLAPAPLPPPATPKPFLRWNPDPKRLATLRLEEISELRELADELKEQVLLGRVALAWKEAAIRMLVQRCPEGHGSQAGVRFMNCEACLKRYDTAVYLLRDRSEEN